MRLWRSLTQPWLAGLLGCCLVLLLHACQSVAPPPSTLDPTTVTPPSPVAVPATPVALPPETEAIVQGSGPNGLFDPPRGDVRFVVISDLNGAYGSTDYDPEVDQGMALIPFWNPDLVLCSGDMVAGQNQSLGVEQLQAMWQAFDHHIAAPLRQAHIPFGFTMGNHDASGATRSNGSFVFQRERDVAAAYWAEPSHDPGVEWVDRFEFPFYYTFQVGDIFVLVWDGSTSQIPSAKLAWVEQALGSPAAQSARLRILMGHLPLYGIAVGRDQPGEVMNNAAQLQAMLERYNVHTYISGHQHAYYPAHKGNLQLLHMGILGSGPRRYIDSELPPRKSMTVVDVDFASPELTTYTTFDMQTLQPITLEELPRFLSGHNGMVLRRDLEMEDLTVGERSHCETKLRAELCQA